MTLADPELVHTIGALYDAQRLPPSAHPMFQLLPALAPQTTATGGTSAP